MDPPETEDALEVSPFPWEHEDVRSYHSKLRKGKSSEEILSDHIELIRKLDIEAALKRIVIADGINAMITNVEVPDDGAGLPPALHEYLIGLLFAHGTPTGSLDVPYERLAGPILDLAIKSLIPGEIDPDLPGEEKLRLQVEFSLKEQVFMAGQWRFTDQSLEAARRAYEPHDKYLKSELGFTIGEALDCGDFLEDQFGRRRMRVVDWEFFDIISKLATAGHTVDSQMRQFQKEGVLDGTSSGEDFQKDAGVIEGLYQKSKNVKGAFFISEDELVNACPPGIDQDVLSRFLERFSDDLGDVNSNPNFRWPYQFNPLSKTPLIRIGDRYITPNGDAIREALMDSPYYDLINIEGYGNPGGSHGGDFGRIFGDYLENWAFECLCELYPEDALYSKPLYTDDFGEACDILVEGQDTLFVIECKVAKLPIHIRNEDYSTIQQELHSKIGEGYSDQALPLVQKIRDDSLRQFVYDGDAIEVDDYDKFRPIIIVGEPYDSIATQLIDVIIEKEDVAPYITEIFSLQVITEFFDSQVRFERFVEERMELFDQRSILSGDEIDYLGLYFLNGNSFPDMEEKQFMMMADMGSAIGKEIDWKFGK